MPDDAIKAWDIVFTTDPAASATLLASVKIPFHVQALATPVPVEDMLAATAGPGDRFRLLVIPVSAQIPAEFSRQVEDWPGLAPRSSGVVRASLRATRIVTTSARAAVFAAPDQIEDATDAVLRFACVFQAVLKLEADMDAALLAMAQAHSGSASGLAQKSKNQANASTMAKISLVGLQKAIEQFDPGISVQSRRLFSELSDTARLSDRLESLEEPVHAVYDYYDMSNWRKDDGRHFNVTLVIELLILLALIGELVVMLWQSRLI